MKFLVVLFPAFLITVSANTCDDCTAVVNTLADYLTTEESIGKQVEILLDKICPGAEDSDGCVAGLPEFWNKIALMLWPGYYNPEESFMCAKDDICGAPGPKLVMTCDECVDGINASIDQLLSEEFIAGIVEWLSGEEFCGVEEDPEMCANLISQLIPAALPALAAGFDPEGARDICNMAVPDNCMGKESEGRVAQSISSNQIRYEIYVRDNGVIDLEWSRNNDHYWNGLTALRVEEMARQILPSIDQAYRREAVGRLPGRASFSSLSRAWSMIITAADTPRLVAVYTYGGQQYVAPNDPRIQAGQQLVFQVHYTVPPRTSNDRTHFTINIWVGL